MVDLIKHEDGVFRPGPVPLLQQPTILAVEFLYYLGEGPNPSQCTEDRPMGDSSAITIAVQVRSEDARRLDEMFQRLWGLNIHTQESHSTPTTRHFRVIATPQPAAPKEGT